MPIISAAAYFARAARRQIGIGERSRWSGTFRRGLRRGGRLSPRRQPVRPALSRRRTLRIGALEAVALATPGHTPTCMTNVIGDAAFVGDTLFMPIPAAPAPISPAATRAPLPSTRRVTRLSAEDAALPSATTAAAGRSDRHRGARPGIHLRDGIDEDLRSSPAAPPATRRRCHRA